MYLKLDFFNQNLEHFNFLIKKVELGGSFGMSLEGDCHEVEVTPNLEFLVTFYKLEGILEGASYIVSLHTHI
jgi:hypothetical protein